MYRGWQQTDEAKHHPLGVSLILAELPNPGSYRASTHTLTDNLSWQFGSDNPHTVQSGGRDFPADFINKPDTATV